MQLGGSRGHVGECLRPWLRSKMCETEGRGRGVCVGSCMDNGFAWACIYIVCGFGALCFMHQVVGMARVGIHKAGFCFFFLGFFFFFLGKIVLPWIHMFKHKSPR